METLQKRSRNLFKFFDKTCDECTTADKRKNAILRRNLKTIRKKKDEKICAAKTLSDDSKLRNVKNLLVTANVESEEMPIFFKETDINHSNSGRLLKDTKNSKLFEIKEKITPLVRASQEFISKKKNSIKLPSVIQKENLLIKQPYATLSEDLDFITSNEKERITKEQDIVDVNTRICLSENGSVNLLSTKIILTKDLIQNVGSFYTWCEQEMDISTEDLMCLKRLRDNAENKLLNRKDHEHY